MPGPDGRLRALSGTNADDDEVDDMPYILCELDRASGEVRLLSTATFDTPAEATRALTTAEARRPGPRADVFLVDLDVATPVVVVPVGVDVAPVEADRALVGTVDAPGSGSPEPGPALIPEEPWVMSSAAADADEPAPESPGADWQFVPDDDASVGPTVLGDELAEDDVARSELWWVEVGAEDEAPAAGAEPEAPTYGADAADIADVAAELSALVGEIPREEPRSEEQAIDQEPLPDLGDAVGADPGLVEEVEDATFVQMDYDAWRCSDCVFTVTCPRTGVDRPATCGSFQWRTE